MMTSSFLLEIGFEKSENDECVLNSVIEGHPVHIAVFVDDFKITCKKDSIIMSIESQLKSKYKDLRSTYGMTHTYLGMDFDYSQDGKVKISMISKLTKECNTSKKSKTPASDDLFTKRDIPLLPQLKQEAIHSGVAKLLYFSTRVRPDTLLL
jgi:hypothetical protein